MGDNRNMFLAIGLSLAVIILWQFFFIEPKMQAEREAQQVAQQSAETTTSPTATPNSAVSTGPSDIPSAPQSATSNGATPATAAVAPAAGVEAPRVPIDTPRVDGSISLVGARIDDVKLKDYHVTVDDESPEIVLLSPVGTAHPYFVETGWVPADTTLTVPASDTLWTLESGETLTPDTPVTLAWDNGAGLVFRRTISVDENYMFTVSQSVENTSDAAVTLYPYSRVRRQGEVKTSGFFILHEGMIGVVGDDGLVQTKYKDLQEAGVEKLSEASDGWLGITDKYWATAVIPDPGQTFTPRFLYAGSNGVPAYQADYMAAAVEIAPGTTGEAVNRVFAGAKETNLIRSYEQTLGIDRFNLLIDWGWFYFITKPMFFALDFVYGLVGNFGVAILIVTVMVKLLFFPLAQRAYVSMAKMKALQPKVQQMRERYKDDRMKQQQAMMEMYKKEKVNPLAGCIPIVIQIPVFFSLYKVLFVTIEMRHAPFFGWINDLSAPDPTTVFNLFGLIPWDPSTVPMIGHFLMLGVWPMIMGVSMWLQMKMNPTPPDPTQAMIFNWMPVFFTFLLASFPAGLVIYWAWNNSLSVTQQYVIMRRQGVKVELWDNIARLFRRSKKEKGAT
ncbi:membrane protein insertase YidC [Acuticoccus mangrovi]|uniref:Membrane protein insertase YidC n=1 Tax=Acuticoccus mangrovi TaxID=2796142 RepID=A0A934IND1_9HYPH|nr:membrane protein insertase YidC [Acuticoccus mangrovi]MBJ3775387.1 membrane protein insertase YidC [Acuticoccus mangrovi]